jgi:hypothetical protein
MTYNDYASVQWWESIRGPAAFIGAIVENLRSKHFVMLYVPEDLPWRKQLRSSAESALRGYENDLMIDYIDWRDECPDAADISSFLLKKYADSAAQNGYRVASGKTIQQYMIDCDVLKDRVLWIKGVDEGQEALWVSFCADYRPASIHDGLLVIELYNSAVSNKNVSSQIKTLDYDDYVTDYDALLFDNLLAAEKNLTVLWKQYAAWVVSALCERDVEISERIIHEADFSKDDVIVLTEQIAQSEIFEKRRMSEKLKPSHPFSIIRSGNLQELKRRIWKAQLQLIFPLIEIERLNFIAKWKTHIEEAVSVPYLDIQSGGARTLTQYDEYLSNAADAEIGTIGRMMRLRRFDEPDEYLLYLPDENDRKRLNLLHEMRNNLAHMKSCAVEQVKDLFADFPYWH